MAQLRDLIVNGASRLIGDAYTNKIQINTISAYTDSGKTTYGLGNSGQILKSDGANVYWANDNNSGGTVTSVQVQASSPLQSSTSSAQSASLNTTISFTDQNANTILAGPNSGSTAPPSFRALVPEDIPGLSSTAIGSTNIPIYWDGDSFEQANGIFESLSYGHNGSDNNPQNVLKIKINNYEESCNIKMQELKIGDKIYDGNKRVEIGITDLGLTKAMTFKGITETVLTDEATTSPVNIIGGSNLTPTEGDVVLYKTDSQEFVWSGGKWHLLGLASSFALQNHIHGNISNDGKLKINNTIAPNKSVVTNSTGDITAKEQHFIFKGTCATAAGTAVKAVTCTDFTSTDLVKGAAIAVVFSVTNSAAVAKLKLNVNSTGEKPIKYMYNNAVNNIPAVGYLLANQTYLFHYDGTNWVIDNMHYNTDNNTVQRVWGSTTNIELPIVGLSSANSSTATFTNMASLSYRAYYGAIPNVTTDRPTLNPSTGKITIPGGLKVGVGDSTKMPTIGIDIHDTNIEDFTPGTINKGINFFFTNKTNPVGDTWCSGLYIHGGQGSNYGAWCLTGPAGDANVSTKPLYVRTSKSATEWGTYRKIYDEKNPPTSKKTITLSTSWSGSGPYTQTVTLSGTTANTKVDLQPDATIINQLIDDGVLALYIYNNNGTLTAYAVGEKPTVALTIQCTTTEVI